MPPFKVHAPYEPTGDQPRAIADLVRGIQSGIKAQTLLGATGTGKSVSYDDPVFIVEQHDTTYIPRVTPIGPLIDSLIEQAGRQVRFDRDTTIVDAGLREVRYFAQSFNPQTCQVDLYPIEAFTRHTAPSNMYRLETVCGRRVTLTGDHNLWVLRDGQLQMIETADARSTDRIPLPETLLAPGTLTRLDTVAALAGKPLFVDASAAVLKFTAQHGPQAFTEAIDAHGISGYNKLYAVRHNLKGRGIALDVFRNVLQQTNNLGDHWQGSAARVGIASSMNRLAVDIPLTPGLLRLLGYYIAEGNGQHDCIIIANRHPLVRQHIEVALSELRLPFVVQPSSDYRIFSRTLAELLGSLCGKHARAKRLPPFWTQLSNADLGVMLQAYFDGDGTVDRASAISAVTASKQLASDLVYALLRFGIWARTTRRWKRATNTDHAGDWYYQVTVSGQHDLRKFDEHIGFAINYKQARLKTQLDRDENSNVDLVPIDGTTVRWLRQQVGIAARELGERSNLSRSAVQLIEVGQRTPQRANLVSILEGLYQAAQGMALDQQWWQTWQRLRDLCRLRWTAIKSVEPIEHNRPYVYDFSVPGAETFLAGSGGLFVHNTYVMAKVVEQVQRPTLVMAHNKTLAAQLFAEFKEFFPDNAVAYFVSYYDQYTPEAYVPSKDLYIEKEASINEEIDRLRHEATQSLLTRPDVLIVASVSAIYGLGSPKDYGMVRLPIRTGEVRNRDKILRQLIDLQFERNDIDFHRGTFRVRGDTLEIFPANAETAYRVEFWGDEIERIVEVDPLTGELLVTKGSIDIFPAKHFITTGEKLHLAIKDIQDELTERLAELEAEGKQLEAQRLKQRTQYDLEMLAEMGYCSGIENYSRHMDRRLKDQTPWTLLDYFPDDFLLFVDESHISVPQVGGMFKGDRQRKNTLVDYGFRLPSALDNRPLHFEEWEQHIHQVVFVSATPREYEFNISEQVVEQIIRPTGLVDPMVQMRPTSGQIDDLLHEINLRVQRGERALVTTLTKRMAEDLADYLKEMGVRTQYLHADIDVIERVEILRDLRLGVFDVVVGINLLREGLDLPEVSLVAILEADKEGYLRSTSALIQTIGRAARHVEGTVLMYADKITASMEGAIRETQRRRDIQMQHNRQHGIEPRGIVKQVRDLTNQIKRVAEAPAPYLVGQSGEIPIPKDELLRMIKEVEKQMKTAAANLEFEKAAMLRDQLLELRRTLALEDTEALLESVNPHGKARGGSTPQAASYTITPPKSNGKVGAKSKRKV